MPALRFLPILVIPITFVCGILNTNLVAILTNEFHVSVQRLGEEASLLDLAASKASIIGILVGGWVSKEIAFYLELP